MPPSTDAGIKAVEQAVAANEEMALQTLISSATLDPKIPKRVRGAQLTSMTNFVNDITAQTNTLVAGWIREQLPGQYMQGAWELKLQTPGKVPLEWNLLHRQAVSLIARDAFADVAKATTAYGEAFKGAIRFAAQQQVLEDLIRGTGGNVVSKGLEAKLKNLLSLGFKDKAGRVWSLRAYTAMLMRTKRQAAYNAGATLRAAEMGATGFVIFDGSRPNSDQACKDKNNKTCSLAWSLANPLEHPNCTRAFGPLDQPPFSGKFHYGSVDDGSPLNMVADVKDDSTLLYGNPPTDLRAPHDYGPHLKPLPKPKTAAKPKPSAVAQAAKVPTAKVPTAKQLDAAIIKAINDPDSFWADEADGIFADYQEGLLNYQQYVDELAALMNKADLPHPPDLKDALKALGGKAPKPKAVPNAPKTAATPKAAPTPSGSVHLKEPSFKRPHKMDAPDHVKNHHRRWLRIVSQQEKQAVQVYTGSAYHEMNALLRNRRDRTKLPTSGTGARRVKLMANALAKADVFDQPVTVYRGVQGLGPTSGTWQERLDWVKENFKPGSVVEPGQFESTSTSPGFSAGWASRGVLFEIEARKGVWVRPISSHPGEDELILNHDTKYEVVRVLDSVEVGNHGPRTIVQLRQVID